MIDGLDLEPAERPSAFHCRDAVQKGLGRAVLWAKKGEWKETGVLLEACLNDLRYDRQCEEARGTWLWEIMEVVGAVDVFRGAILEALQRIDDGLAAQQLCQFCVLYAQQGDERFRSRLQDIVAHKPAPACPWLGEEELIELDREAGLLFAAQARGKALRDREWEGDDTSMIDAAVARLGEQAVLTLVDRESASSANVRRFRENWLAARERKPGKPGQSHADSMRQLSLDDVIRQAENARNRAMYFRGWGMYASEGDLRVVLNRLLASRSPDVLVNYLRVFSNRPMPHFDGRVLDLLDHADENVRSRAYTAVAQNTHSAIRQFAVRHIRERFAVPNFLELFIKNYQPEDGELLQTSLSVPEDPDHCHGVVWHIIKILEQNLGAPCRELALPAYRVTPCGRCRFRAAELLVTRKVVPPWLVEECRWDSVPRTRELALQSSQATTT